MQGLLVSVWQFWDSDPRTWVSGALHFGLSRWWWYWGSETLFIKQLVIYQNVYLCFMNHMLWVGDVPTLQISKLRLNEGKWFAPGLTALRRPTHDCSLHLSPSNPYSQPPRDTASTSVVSCCVVMSLYSNNTCEMKVFLRWSSSVQPDGMGQSGEKVGGRENCINPTSFLPSPASKRISDLPCRQVSKKPPLWAAAGSFCVKHRP